MKIMSYAVIPSLIPRPIPDQCPISDTLKIPENQVGLKWEHQKWVKIRSWSGSQITV